MEKHIKKNTHAFLTIFFNTWNITNWKIRVLKIFFESNPFFLDLWWFACIETFLRKENEFLGFVPEIFDSKTLMKILEILASFFLLLKLSTPSSWSCLSPLPPAMDSHLYCVGKRFDDEDSNESLRISKEFLRIFVDLVSLLWIGDDPCRFVLVWCGFLLIRYWFVWIWKRLGFVLWWIFLKVLEIFLEIVEFDPWDQREKVGKLFMRWRQLNGIFFWHLVTWPFIGCQVYLDQWERDTCNWTLGLFCKNRKLRTKLQF